MIHNNALSLLSRAEYSNVGVDASISSTRVCATLQAVEIPEQNEFAAPVDLIVSLDVSGSMNGSKLNLCKQTLTTLVQVLKSSDRFGLVTYASEAQLDFVPTKMTPEAKKRAFAVIQELSTRGCTNISAGLGLAVQELSRLSASRSDSVRAIFLLTDGLANEGISEENALVKFTGDLLRNEIQDLAKEFNPKPAASGRSISRIIPSLNNVFSNIGRTVPQAQQTQTSTPRTVWEAGIDVPPNIALHTFGYGSDHNASLLRRIAEVSGNGNYYFIEQDNNVKAAFGDCLGGLASVVAQNCLLDIQLSPVAQAMGARIEKVLHDKVIQREDQSYSVSLGDFYSEESRDILVEVKLATPTTELSVGTEPIPHVDLTVSYFDMIAKCLVRSETVSCSVRRPPGNEVGSQDPYVVSQCLRVKSVHFMSEADQKAKEGDLSKAKAYIKEMRDEIAAAPRSVQESPAIAELFRDMDQLESGLQSKADYDVRGSKLFSTNIRKNTIQRAAVSEETEVTTSYSNKSRDKMMKRFTKS